MIFNQWTKCFLKILSSKELKNNKQTKIDDCHVFNVQQKFKINYLMYKIIQPQRIIVSII